MKGQFWASIRGETKISSTIFLMSVAIGIIPPILPLITEHFGISVGAVALVVSCFGVARLLADIPAGFLADRLNQLSLLRLGAVFLIRCFAIIATTVTSLAEDGKRETGML